jgi:hypothetical protein
MNHKRNKLSVVCIALMLLWAGCQTSELNIGEVGASEKPLEKAGTLAKREVWAGKILITGDVIVPQGITLTIRPDAVIGFDPTTGTHQFIIHGELYAEGEPNRFITFGSLGASNAAPKAGDWKGIHITASSPGSRFSYCRIQHADVGMLCQSDAVQIERCLLTDNKAAILCDNTSPLISENEINKNGTAIKCIKSAAPEIARNAIVANEYGVVCDDDSRPMIHHNELNRNYQHAILCYASASPEVAFNNIILNGGWAVYDGGRLRENFIRGNNEQGAETIERGTGRDSGQFYGVDEVLDPRSAPVSDAGIPRDR